MLKDFRTNVFEVLVGAFSDLESHKTNRLTNFDKKPFDLTEMENEVEELRQLNAEIANEIEFRWKLKSEMATLENVDQEAFLICDAVFLLKKHFDRLVV